MKKKYQVYQIIDHPTLIQTLREVCMLELSDSDIKSVSMLNDLGDCLYELTTDAIKGLSNSHSVAATILAIDTGVTYVIDLKEAFT